MADEYNNTQSQAIAVGPQLYVSGQIPGDKDGNLVEGSIADKTKACCANIAAILKEAGTDVSRVVKVRRDIVSRIHLQGPSSYGMNPVS